MNKSFLLGYFKSRQVPMIALVQNIYKHGQILTLAMVGLNCFLVRRALLSTAAWVTIKQITTAVFVCN